MSRDAMRLWSMACVICGMSAVGRVALGDELVFADGRHVSGKVTAIEGTQITFLPTSAGEAGESISTSLADLESIEIIPSPPPPERSRILIESLDGGRVTTASAKVKLRSGQHQMNLTYWQQSGPNILRLQLERPSHPREDLDRDHCTQAVSFQKLKRSKGNDAEGYRLPDISEETKDHCAYRLKQWSHSSDVQSVADLRHIPTEKYGSRSLPDLSLKHPQENFAITYQFLFNAAEDGEYTFFVESFGQARLSLGALPADEQLNSAKVWKKWVVSTRSDGRLVGTIREWQDNLIQMEFEGTPQPYVLLIDDSWFTEAWQIEVERGSVVVDRSGEPAESDSVYAKGNNDQVQRVSGKLLGFDGEKLRFEFNGQERSIAMERVLGFVRRNADAKEAPPLGLSGIVQLPQQQRLPGLLTAITPQGMATLELPWGGTIELKRSDLIRQTITGGRLQWLSSLTPSNVIETPYFDRRIPWRRNTSLTGDTIRIGERSYRQGVSQHSRSKLTYTLDGGYERFQADVGLLKPEGLNGQVTVRVLLDGDVAFEREHLVATDGPLPVDLDLTGRKELSLEVDFGNHLDIADHVGWGHARLLKAKTE
ncbi:MAG: NPCBM/NEW2 domain-containing protein [Planctomycetaceae bacterium]